MPKWLTKARAAFKTSEPEPPEPFRLVCACGGVIQGKRREQEQRIRCGDCGYEMFVMPESVYPPPQTPHRAFVEVEEIELIEDVPTVAPAGPADAITLSPEQRKLRDRKRAEKEAEQTEKEESPAKQPASKKRTPLKKKSAQTAAAAPKEAPAVEIDHVHGIRDRRLRRFKFFTPFRMIACGILLVLFLTGYFVIHSRRVANAEVVRLQAAKLGQQALADGDLETAVRELTKVQEALEILGSDDAESQQLHQMFLEVRAATELIPHSLQSLVLDAIEDSENKILTGWAAKFSAD